MPDIVRQVLAVIADLETLRRVIGNCYISAKRGLSAGRKGVITFSPEVMVEKRDEQLQNIRRHKRGGHTNGFTRGYFGSDQE